MLIRLLSYKEDEPVSVEHQYDPTQLDVNFDDFIFKAPIDMKGEIEKGSVTLTFRGQLQSTVEQVCGRCLKTATKELIKPFELYYETKDKETIDTTDDLRELVLLDHPMVYFCTDNGNQECNIQSLGATESPSTENLEPNNPFAALKGKLNRSKKEKENGTS